MIHHFSLAALAGALVLVFPYLVSGVDVTSDPALVASLKTAATVRDRMALLPKDSDWLYTFTDQDYYTFTPGGVINANAATFPATVGNGMTMAILNLGPCSMLPMHHHPRASNYVYAVWGTTNTYMIEENGVGVIKETLTPGKMTIFPQASVHMMVNMGCTNSQLVSALNSEDPGTLNLGYAMQNLPSDLYNAALGYSDISNNATLAAIWPIGTGSNYGLQSCRAVCAAAATAAAANTTASEEPVCGPPLRTHAGPSGY